MEEIVKTNSLRAWVLAARPKTLPAAITPVVIGSALAYHLGSFDWILASLCMIFAVMMQIAANLINDLYDFIKGSDREDRLGPERAMANGWISKHSMIIGICIVIAIGGISGLMTLPFISQQARMVMIIVGIACSLFAYCYTSGPFPLSYNALGDVSVILFFGITAVTFTCYVQCESMVDSLPFVLWIGTATGIVINALLLVNNYRDRDQDQISGKRTLITIFGEPFGRYMYLASGFVAATIIIACFWQMMGAKVMLLVCPYLLLHCLTWHKLSKIRQGKGLNILIAQSSRNMLVFALSLTYLLTV